MLDTVFHLASGFSVQVYSGQQFSLNGACVDEADVLKLRKGFMDFFQKAISQKAYEISYSNDYETLAKVGSIRYRRIDFKSRTNICI